MVYKERLGDSDEIGQRYLSNLIHIYARAAKANGAKIAMKWKGDSYAPATTLTNDTGEEFDFVLGQPAFADSVYFNCVDDKIIMMNSVKQHFNVPEYILLNKRITVDSALSHVNNHIADVKSDTTLPVIVKPNKGSRSNHVYIARDQQQLKEALQANIEDNHHGRHIIVQQCIEDAVDVRAIVMDGECVYAKTTERFDQITTNQDFEDLNDVQVTDKTLLTRLDEAATYLLNEHGLEYAGLDFRMDKGGKLWFIEANSGPMGIDRIPEEPRERLLAKIFDRVMAGKEEQNKYRLAQYRMCAHAKAAYVTQITQS